MRRSYGASSANTNTMTSPSTASDAAVIATADDAVLAKLSASDAGYYDDPFVGHMAQGAHGLTSSSGTSHPIIRKGTHARVCAMDRAIATFLSLTTSEKRRQVVVLGAGKDTSFLRYKAGLLLSDVVHSNSNNNDNRSSPVRWYEVDHLSVILEKKRLLTCPCLPSQPQPFSLLERSELDDAIIFTSSSNNNADADATTSITSDEDTLHLVPYDLRSPPSQLFQTLMTSKQHNFRVDVPTLFLLECVQMYLPEESSRKLLTTISQHFTTTSSNSNSNDNDNTRAAVALVALYDPVLLDDNFGRVMQDHLTRAIMGRNYHKQEHNNHADTFSMLRTRTLPQQLDKMISCGFHVSTGCDMLSAYNSSSIVSCQQRLQANRVEMLDELEEWALIMRHYCIVVAGCSTTNTNSTALVEAFCQVTAATSNAKTTTNHTGSPPGMGFQRGACTTMPTK